MYQPKPGDRVRLTRCDDPHTNLEPGDLGTVSMVDNCGTVHINWDNGSILGLLPKHDEFEVLYESEL